MNGIDDSSVKEYIFNIETFYDQKRLKTAKQFAYALFRANIIHKDEIGDIIMRAFNEEWNLMEIEFATEDLLAMVKN